MRVEPLGDAAFVVRDLPGPAHAVADAIAALRLPGVVDSAASYETVGVYLAAPGAISLDQMDAALASIGKVEVKPGWLHEIAVCYEKGEDSEEVCETLGLSHGEMVDLHSSGVYTCFAVGFSPGFPYLGWLPERLQNIPRRASPRVRVPAGSVAITGRQTAVYPSSTPGGWALIGRTPLVLVDVVDRYFPIVAGDLVRFVPIDATEFAERIGERLPMPNRGGGAV